MRKVRSEDRNGTGFITMKKFMELLLLKMSFERNTLHQRKDGKIYMTGDYRIVMILKKMKKNPLMDMLQRFLMMKMERSKLARKEK